MNDKMNSTAGELRRATVVMDRESWESAWKNNLNGQPKTLSGSMRRDVEESKEPNVLVLTYRAPVAPKEGETSVSEKYQHSRITVKKDKVFFSFQMDIPAGGAGRGASASEIANVLSGEVAQAVAFMMKNI